MASIFIHLLLLLLNFSLSLSSPIFLPLSKHPLTNLHLTQPEPRTNLLLDLNSPFLWLTPNKINNVSIIPPRSIPCSSSGIHQSDSNHHCTLPVTNSLTGHTTLGHLVKTRLYHINDFLLVLAPSPSPGLLTGLPTSVKGVLGLGRNRVGIVQQLTHSFTLSNTFSICLSSSSRTTGFVLLGEDRQLDMVYTPILTGTSTTDSYRINLRSINIQNNKFITLTQPSSIKITTTTPYTLIKSSIYKDTITAFTTATDQLRMIRVAPTGGFELCYNIQKNDIKKVPVIDLVLQSEMVKWSIHGHNLMVKINDDVMCLGILDGGDELEDVIVLGNHQLEDNLVEFDLGRSMIGFTSSLLVKDTSCSSLRTGLASRDGGPDSGKQVI